MGVGSSRLRSRYRERSGLVANWAEGTISVNMTKRSEAKWTEGRLAATQLLGDLVAPTPDAKNGVWSEATSNSTRQGLALRVNWHGPQRDAEDATKFSMRRNSF